MCQIGLEHDRFDTQCREDIAVSGITGGGKSNPVPRIEARQKTQQKSAGGSGRDGDPSGIDFQLRGLAVVARDPGAQGRQTSRVCVTDPVVPKGRARGVENRARR